MRVSIVLVLFFCIVKLSLVYNISFVFLHCTIAIGLIIIITIVYIYHALLNALSAHTIHINLYTILYTHVDHSPSKTIYRRYYIEAHTHTHTHTHTHLSLIHI